MLFNSWEYAVFLPLVFLFYWYILRNRQQRNLFLLVVSYIFYGWWDYRFLALIFISSVADFILGQRLYQTKKAYHLGISLCINLGILGYFKYANFFIENFIQGFESIGIQLHVSTLQIILPVGISFYTFQTLSYTLDIYRGKLKPESNFINFLAFVSFFPQLVAGPIERASNLLPQFNKDHKINYDQWTDGLRQILAGLFKKMVIADNCALVVDQVYGNPDAYPGSALLIASVFFAFQIYGDFSGYSDIAIGSARLFGFQLMDNFRYPYFSRNIAEFWRRWHISLSTWFRDYIYIPLGGSRVGQWLKIRNVLVIFLVSGFWHGANWTFVFWGFLNALYFMPLLLSKRNRAYLAIVGADRRFPNGLEILQMGTTFFLTTIGWIFFRAQNIQEAFTILAKIGSPSLFQSPGFRYQILLNSGLLFIFLVLEWHNRRGGHFLDVKHLSRLGRWSLYLITFWLLFTFGVLNQKEFIYFQF